MGGRNEIRNWKHPHGRGEDPQAVRPQADHEETPPRAWGRRTVDIEKKEWVRNTPTGVGKTFYRYRLLRPHEKHPHGRGEDRRSSRSSISLSETPPRAWGRRRAIRRSLSFLRNTPTGVGKTVRPSAPSPASRKHPHGRGEDCSSTIRRAKKLETPPRAWGRQRRPRRRAARFGNTPTGVGKTAPRRQPRPCRQKHPHGRGEDTCAESGATWPPETPPRAWGRRKAEQPGRRRRGNTPTGVGKTPTNC